MSLKTFDAEEAMTDYLTSPEFLEKENRRQELVGKLTAKGIPFLIAMVMAGDLQSAEDATEMVKNGMAPEDALNYIGSYARFGWAMVNLPRETLFERLPELWVGADPDDTDPGYLKLWREAFVANQGVIIQDDAKAKLPRRRQFTVYRGQVGDQVGISWTLDPSIARKFSLTGGLRQEVSDGRILTLKVSRADILAYLTGRSESELIIDVKRETIQKQLRS